MKNPKFNKAKNSKFNKAKNIHKDIESLLFRCQSFSDHEKYPDIVDGLTRVLKAINEVKIDIIKALQGNDKSSKLEE